MSLKKTPEQSTVRETPRISKKKTMRVSLISSIVIASFLIGGILWKFSYDLNSNYRQIDLDIAFIHANGGYNQDLYDRLALDEGAHLKALKEEEIGSNTLEKYDLVIVSNVDLSSSTREYVASYVKSSNEHSVILLMGENSKGGDLQYLNLTKGDTLDEFKEDDNELGYGICRETENVPELTGDIPWNTMPEIKKYTQLSKSDYYTEDAKTTETVLEDVSSEDSDDIFLFYKNLKQGGHYLVFTIWFDHELNINELTRSFPYLSYFFYSSYLFLENKEIPAYYEWPYSPVPHFIDIFLIALIVGALAIGSFVAFNYVRNYSEKNPLTGIEALETEEEKKAKEKVKEKVEEIEEELDAEVCEEDLEKLQELKKFDKELTFEEIEAELPEHCRGWDAIGLHRQISGFWTVLFLLLILILPLAAFFLWIFPTFIFSSPSGMGYYNFVGSFFGALWVFADFGTSYWMIRKFAAHRVKDPEKAIASAQCFIWFQMLTGAFQIVGVGFLGALVFPYTPWWSHLTYVFVWYSIFQFMGFFWVFVEIMNAFQRSDLANVSRAAMVPLFMLVQSTIVPLFTLYGSLNPEIGIALGAAIGASIANFTSQIALFLSTWFLFKKTFGYSGISIFRIDFDWSMVKDMLSFGWKIAVGQTLVPLVLMLEVILLSLYLNNYSNWLGYINLGNTLIQVYQVVNFFAQSMTPSLSEAKENGKINLLNYNITDMLRWVNHFNFWLSSALFAIAPALILTITPPEFQNMVVLVPLLLVFSLLGPFSWMGDYVFVGTDFPNLARNAWILEQSIRGVLLLIFIPLFASNPSVGIFSIYFAYIPALFIKNIFVWALIKTKVVPGLKLYGFKSFVAPALAGISFYLITLLLINVTGGGLIGVIIAAAFALVMGPFVFFFLSSIFGGWSDYGLEEFRRSVSIMKVGGFVGAWLHKCCIAGSKFSPWKEKGNIETYTLAQIEAWELTLEKKKIGKI